MNSEFQNIREKWLWPVSRSHLGT